MYKRIGIFIALCSFSQGYAETNMELLDPTHPYTMKSEGDNSGSLLQSLRLCSVLNSEGRKVAIINDHPYQIGEPVINNYKVSDIQRNHVVLAGPDGNFILNFPILDKTNTVQKVGNKP